MRTLWDLLTQRDLRSALFRQDWDYLYYCYFASPNAANLETMISIEGSEANNITHVGLCAPTCQCSDATTLAQIQAIS